MKKLFPVLMCAVLIAGVSGVAFADLTSSAQTRVAINVVSTVGTVVTAAPTVNFQVGDPNPFIDVTFGIHSNSEMLQFTPSATHLYKGGVYGGLFYLTATGGVKIVCQNAGIINGAANPTPYTATTTILGNSGDWAANQATTVIFDSADRGTFSQNCTLTFTWTSSDLELPVGQYSGYVKLIACVVPVGGPVLAAPVLR
jgi:hypothetical protein